VSSIFLADQFGSYPVHRPGSVAEVCELVKTATGAVYPVGGGTSLDIGFAPSKPGLILDTRGLNSVIEHAARDMTVTVQAGMTMQTLANLLDKENQWLPIDVPHPEQATLGGAVAANLSGPRRLGQGTFRDYVIGVNFVTDEGIEVKGGGRVVKNVAGYDLMKLMIGSLGTLGVITQLTLKVKPKPEASAIVTFGVNEASIGPTLDRLHSSTSRPTAIEVVNQPAKLVGLNTSEPWLIACGYEEKRATVDWQIKTLSDEMNAAPVRGVVAHRDADATQLWSRLSQLQQAQDGWLTLKANCLPSQVSQMLTRAAAAYSQALVHAHAGSGIVYVNLPTEIGVERASTICSELSNSLTTNGNLIVLRCPPDWKKMLSVWGKNRVDRELMMQIQQTLDPKGLFNPGRFFQLSST
jgi:glycolate oxidase FAD binding subunit